MPRRAIEERCLIAAAPVEIEQGAGILTLRDGGGQAGGAGASVAARSEEHTSELQSHRDIRSFPTRRSSDLMLDRHRASGDLAVRRHPDDARWRRPGWRCWGERGR